MAATPTTRARSTTPAEAEAVLACVNAVRAARGHAPLTTLPPGDPFDVIAAALEIPGCVLGLTHMQVPVSTPDAALEALGHAWGTHALRVLTPAPPTAEVMLPKPLSAYLWRVSGG